MMKDAKRSRLQDIRLKILANAIPLSVGLVVLGALLFWLIPHRKSEVITVDGKHRWGNESAPARRSIVWQPAVSVDTVPTPAAAKDSLIRPQLDASGTVLYFTLQQHDGTADIYRSQWADGTWQAAVAEQSLNTPADDIGPVISADGSRLYLYSNRAGGQGGFDLYVSYREGNHWTPPKELGPEINSPADEYDPAVSTDGKQLFFSSNRTAEMNRALQADRTKAKDRWRTTLRSDQVRTRFNLYLATRSESDNPWQPARALNEINLATANDGAPYVSADGAFLYFASDRTERSGEAANFDLYRARILPGRMLSPENLGTGVNTADNEIEPALSAEGFRLYFSRNDARSQQPEQYALYSSTAREIYDETTWDASHWTATLGVIRRHAWWVSLLALLAGLIAALVWFFRNVSLRRVPIPGALLVALVLHLMLGAGSFFVYFGGGVMEQIRREVREMIVATRMSSDALHQSHEPGQEAYEKVADLEAFESVQPTEAPRQVTEMPNVPMMPESTVMKVPARLNRDASNPRQVVTVPRPMAPPRQRPELSRQRPTLPEEVMEQANIELEQPLAQQVEQAEPPAAAVAVNQRQTPQTEVRPLQRSRPLPAMQVAQEPIQAEQSVEVPPSPTAEPVRMAWTERRPADQQRQQIVPEPIGPAATQQAKSQPMSTNVEAARRSQQPPVAATPTPRPLARQRVQPALGESSPEPATPAAKEPRSQPAPTALARSRSAVQRLSQPQVATEQVTAPATSAQRAETPQPADIRLARSNQRPQTAPPAALQTERRSAMGPLPASEPIAATPGIRPPQEPPTSTTALTLARATRTPAADSADSQVVAETLSESVSGPQTNEPDSAEVMLARNSTAPEISTSPDLSPVRDGVKLSAAQPSLSALTDAPLQEPSPESTVESPLQRRRSVTSLMPSEDAVATEQVTAVVSDDVDADQSAKLAVAMDRQQTTGAGLPQFAASEVKPESNPRLAAMDLNLPEPDSRQLPVRTTTADPLSGKRNVRPTALAGEEPLELASTALQGEDATKPERPTSSPVTSMRQQSDVPPNLLAAGELPRARRVPVSPSPAGLDRSDPSAVPDASHGEHPLQLNRLVLASATADAIRTDAPTALVIDPTGVEQPEPSAASALELQAKMLELPFETSDKIGGVRDRNNRALVLGSLENEAVDTAPSGSQLASQILRRPARAPVLLYAEDNIGLQAMFRLRQGEAKRDVLEAFGGNDETLVAVERGLTWIEKHQKPDGSWSLNAFGKQCQGHQCTGHGSAQSDAAATGFALLPFLGDGHTHLEGKYKNTIRQGISWLVDHQNQDGNLAVGAGGNTHMYSHGIATIALCEAYAMSKDAALQKPAQDAINYIVYAQHQPSGGWRYQPKQPGDTSVVGWQVMALKSGQMAGLVIPPASLELAKKWLKRVEGSGDRQGTFGYTSPSGTTAMTAEGLLCLEYLGTPRGDARLINGADFLMARLPAAGKETSYYWYYGTQVMFHMQGTYWQRWNAAMRDMLVETQTKTGPMAGTWDPKDNYEKSGGRIYATALRLLMLEVYYRHLPLYQVLDD